jgi:hypothetical protein
LEWYSAETGGLHSTSGYVAHFGINSSDLITVYANDVARLSGWEQRIWAAYNVPPEGKVSSELLAAQVRTEPASTQAAEYVFVKSMQKLEGGFFHGFGISLFTHDIEETVPGKLIEQLLHRLQHEMEHDVRVQQTIEKLQVYCRRKSEVGPVGLEAKLTAADREYEILGAIERKEQFAKLLERWSLYGSAQEIFAYLLARAEHEFTMSVNPHLGIADPVAINQVITQRIVEPTIADCGVGEFCFDHRSAMGMVYWLAEQCFVRWHK